MNTSSTQRAILLSALIVVVTFNQHAVSQEKAWKGSAEGQTAQLIESPGHYDQFSGWGGGQLGNFVAIGTHTMHSDLSLTGQATWVVDGGDLLIVSYDGRVTITEDEVRPYRFNATMQVKEGTGRLQGATGTANMVGSFNATLEQFRFEFDGKLDVEGNLHSSGSMELESMTCGLGERVPYAMTPDIRSMPFGRQTGSMVSTSEPVIDDSDPDITVWTFPVQSSLNENVGRPVHIVHGARGDLYCHFEGQVRLEIDHSAEGLVTKCFDGHFTVIGGTGDYRRARGAWQTTFVTEPSFGGPVTALFSIDGNLDLNQARIGALDLTADGETQRETPSTRLQADSSDSGAERKQEQAALQIQSASRLNKQQANFQLEAERVSTRPESTQALPPLPQPDNSKPRQRIRDPRRSLQSIQPVVGNRFPPPTVLTITGAGGK